MRVNDAQHNCPRQTLNEVLVAELGCLRADLIARPDSPSVAGLGSQSSPPIMPSSPAAAAVPGAGHAGLATAASSSCPDPEQKIHLTAATYDDCEAGRVRNLSNIYRQIGCWSQRSRKGQPGYAPLSAVCLSGGGIRSATFNLGVLQSLARIQLLGKFDYLSSVSGGGYIASWLRAWMHRKGVPDVVTELGSGARGCNPLATEPKPVSNLREYSNYLTPEVGLFSGDTWSVAATIARNLILNWLVLVPLLSAVVGIPLLFLLFIRTTGLWDDLPVYLLALAVCIEVVASVLVYQARRFAKNPDKPQSYFIFRCVLPICLAAGTLSAAGVGLNVSWRAVQPAPSREDLYALWAFAGIWSIGVPVLGWAIAELIAHVVPRAQVATTGKDDKIKGGKVRLSDQQIKQDARQVPLGLEVLALVVSGLIGASLLVGAVTWWFSYLYNHPALYAILVLPLLMGMYLLSRVIFIGITSLNDEQGDRIDQGSRESPEARLRSRISSNDADREWWSRLSGWVLLVITSWVAVTGICLIGCYLPNVLWGIFQIAKENHATVTYVVKGVVAAAGLASGVIAALTASSSQTPAQGNAEGKPTPPSVARILAIAGPLFLVCLIMVLSWGVKGLAEAIIGPSELFRLHFNRPGSAQPVALQATVEFIAVLAGLVVVALIASRISNVNRFSLHGMYRNRLVRAYLGASNCAIDGEERRTPDPFTGFALNDNFPLHRLCAHPRISDTQGDQPGTGRLKPSPTPEQLANPHAMPSSAREGSPDREFDVERPLSIINTTLNLVNGGKLAWQQRKAESFSMTPLFCGSWAEGYRKSKEYGGPGGITVGTAVTISGAAANPNMGYSSSPVLGFLMAIFNVRLGAWLGNPNAEGDRTYSHPGPRHAITPLFAEMFGLTNSKRSYVNLSDGGHFDNLGLYEVVLRRCRQVLVCDAGQDGSFSFEDLGNSIRKIRIDFGINIVFQKIQILPNTPEKEGLCCAIARIRYSDVDETPTEDDGWLIYIKPTLRGRGTQVPYDIYSYSRGSASFPHESTADQWFSESQFESYRALGSHIVEQLTESLGAQPYVDFDAFRASVDDYMRGASIVGASSSSTAPGIVPREDTTGAGVTATVTSDVASAAASAASAAVAAADIAARTEVRSQPAEPDAILRLRP
ncbi:MAG: conserved rane protein of unknown function [Gammaproteobacteria bacterium]|nr:conserved rane protein of unknown function [Gammaproteobacteria bacterium]